MTQKNSSKIISVVHHICCGLDVHKDMVFACIIITDSDGEEKFVVQEFSTFTDDLFKLKFTLIYFFHIRNFAKLRMLIGLTENQPGTHAL